MTYIQKAIMAEIKQQIEGRECFSEYTHLKFISMEADKHFMVECSDGLMLTRYKVVTAAKDKKVTWSVCVFSDGECRVYYEREDYT